MIETSRRSLILGLTGLIAAPTIVRASSLMRVKAYQRCIQFTHPSSKELWGTLRVAGKDTLGNSIISEFEADFETGIFRVPVMFSEINEWTLATPRLGMGSSIVREPTTLIKITAQE